MSMMDKKRGLLDGMSPMQVFTFGIIEGVLVLCTIGFFIMLGVYFGDGSSGGRTVKTPTTPTVAVNPTANPAAAVEVVPVDPENDHIRGEKNAPLTIIEYSDLECPYCESFHNTMKQIVAEYGGEVNWVYRHFPLESIHPNARTAAIASECAAEQGKFWEFADEVFEAQAGGLSTTVLKDIAAGLSLNTVTFSNCLDTKKYDAVVTADIQEAARAGARGTPYSILVGENGEQQVISGAQPYAAVEAAVQAMLK